jgi:hypothetical protein
VVGAGAAWFGLYTNSGSKVLSALPKDDKK